MDKVVFDEDIKTNITDYCFCNDSDERIDCYAENIS